MGSAKSWPIEPPASRWDFPNPEFVHEQDYLCEGADFEPGTLLAAYRKGIFPMPRRKGGPPAWWSPVRRGIIPLQNLRVSRSLRQACRRFEIRIDTAVEDVVRACADPARPGGWISEEIIDAYARMHGLGWMHTVEAWTPDGRLAGGLYGLAIGGLFVGESMFHHERDASKVALVGLVDILCKDGDPAGRLLDVQWQTRHLASLGAVEVSRLEYLRLLEHALTLPIPPVFGDAAWPADLDGVASGAEPGQDVPHA